MANIFKSILKKNVQRTASERSNPERPVQEEAERQSRQRTMLTLLSSIDLNDSLNKLPEETIRQLQIAEVIRFACDRLSADNLACPDAPALDQNITYIISALHEAIRQGFTTTAQWACTALVSCLRDLRTEIPPVDMEYADALMAARLDYSHNLRILVTLSREHDSLYNDLDEHHRRLDAKQTELDRRKSDLAARRDSGMLDAATLKAELDELILFEKTVADLRRSIESDRQRVSLRKSQIESCRNILATPPHVCDPKLQERVNDSYLRYREQLREKLDFVDETKLSRELHLKKIEILLDRDGTPAPTSASPGTPRTKPVRQGPDRQTRQQQMRARLESIDPDSPRNRLSKDQIQELNVAGVIQLARGALSTDNPAIADDPVLDRNILRIINLLEDALVQGYENTAEWACTALYLSVKNLRTGIPEADREYSRILAEQRTAYSENLRLLVELYREHDHVSGILNTQNRYRERIGVEFQSNKEHFEARREHGILDEPLAELEESAHDPTCLSAEALALREDLQILHKLRNALNEIDADIHTNQLLHFSLDSQIETLRIVLANPPHAYDPKLREQVNEAELRYVRQLLSEAKPDDHDALLAENILLRNQVKALQEQLKTCQHRVQNLQEPDLSPRGQILSPFAFSEDQEELSYDLPSIDNP